MRTLYRVFAAAVSAAVITVMGAVLYLDAALPDSFYLTGEQTLSLGTPLQISGAVETVSVAEDVCESRAQLKMLGTVPVKEVAVEYVDRQMVVPCGYPFGIKMFTEGVVVVGLTDVEQNGVFVNPAQQCGIRVGDVITELGGKQMTLNEQVAEIVTQSAGKPLTYTLNRKGQVIRGTLTPVLADNGSYQAGIWVRDSSAGIGTMTFYDPSTLVFAGLGHAVCDVDTGEVLPLGKGEIVDVNITGVNKGVQGAPGELKGVFASDRLTGFMAVNNETGVYGRLKTLPAGGTPVPIALKQEIHTGPAQIYTTVKGSKPKAYDVEIEKIDLSGSAATKNMVLRVTDPELLRDAGGIVQGMSGSPILQDGRLVGAVTHVFVNDLTRGYGIFAENMNQTAQQVVQAQAS